MGLAIGSTPHNSELLKGSADEIGEDVSADPFTPDEGIQDCDQGRPETGEQTKLNAGPRGSSPSV